ncbi:MAG: lipocalin-like domain-containing protein [Verrucomicrobiota bacterium]
MEPREWVFPHDHGQHPDHRTEWWYFTGNLREKATGRRFGYQFTIFRYGVVREPRQPASAWALRDVWFAHFAVSDLESGRFYFSDLVERGSLGAAGASQRDMDVWIRDWRIEPLGAAPEEDLGEVPTLTTAGESPLERAIAEALPIPTKLAVFGKEPGFRIVAEADGYGLELELRPGKPRVFHGPDGTGLSQKSNQKGNASHYYSYTRLLADGTVRVGEERLAVEGTSWFDHEFSTSALADNQDGWDWFSLQLDDETELMVYGIRRSDGSVDPASKGSFVQKDGEKIHLRREDFSITPLDEWKSPKTGATYPSGWEVEVPRLDLALTVTPMMRDQELVLEGLIPVSYWEGACKIDGTRDGEAVTGHGYVELSGYDEALGPGMRQ